MLDLQAGVHFHEVELVVCIEQEFNRTGILVADRLGGAHGQFADVFPLRFGQLRRWRDLDQLLIAALDGAITFIQVDTVAMAVADHLHFDVLRIDDAFFDEHFRLSEGFARLGDDALVVLDQFVIRIAASDAATTTAVGGFQHDRIADFARQFERLVGVFQIVVGTGYDRDAGLDHRQSGLNLVAHLGDYTG